MRFVGDIGSRREWLNGLGTLAVTMALAADSSAAVGQDRPNILLILSDDQAWTDYGFMGHPHIETPCLDDLAATSLTYTRGYVSAPLCRPSLASILTGLPVHVHGTTGNDPATGDPSIRNMTSRKYARHADLHERLYTRLRALPNFVRSLQQAGYATMQTGKWWESSPETFGFDHGMTHGDPSRGARHGDEGLKISRKGIEPIREFLDGLKVGDSTKPFFIWHAPFLPHSPHTPPSDLLEKYERIAPTKPVANYWATCEWFDRTCAELLSELENRGLHESTVVIYICDNGFIQSSAKSNTYGPRSKQTPYEGGVRTPVMIRWPGQIRARIDTGTLVSAIDLAPTILNIARVEESTHLPGIDLRDTAALQKRNTIYGSDHPHDISNVDEPAEDAEARYVVEGPWKLIVTSKPSPEVELFHLGADPYELSNLANRRSALVARLKNKLNRWWVSSMTTSTSGR